MPILVSQPLPPPPSEPPPIEPPPPPPPLSELPPNDVHLIEKAQFIWSFIAKWRVVRDPTYSGNLVKLRNLDEQIEHIIAGIKPPQTTIDIIEKFYSKIISMGPVKPVIYKPLLCRRCGRTGHSHTSCGASTNVNGKKL